MKGKDLCEFLKGIRKNIALYNGIDYIPHECNNIEECSGSCPLCEHEAHTILQELKKRKAEGKYILTDDDAIHQIRKMNKQYEDININDGSWLAGCPFYPISNKDEQYKDEK